MIATEKKCPYCGGWLSFDTRENNFWCELCECTHSIEKIYGIAESVPPIQSRKLGWKTVREITSGLIKRAADGLIVAALTIYLKRLHCPLSTSANTSSKSTLTMEDLQKTIDEVFPILLYGTAEFVKPGDLYHCKETDLSPEYIICHPSDLEQIKKLLPNRRLVHIKDEPQENVTERIIKRLQTRVLMEIKPS